MIKKKARAQGQVLSIKMMISWTMASSPSARGDPKWGINWGRSRI